MDRCGFAPGVAATIVSRVLGAAGRIRAATVPWVRTAIVGLGCVPNPIAGRRNRVRSFWLAADGGWLAAEGGGQVAATLLFNRPGNMTAAPLVQVPFRIVEHASSWSGRVARRCYRYH
jgi:hypothetical protein